jgi:RNA-binding protein
MDLIGKQKRYLRSLAVNIRPIVQVGKGGLTDEIKDSVRAALDARELIKVTLLQNASVEIFDVADSLEEMGFDVIQQIGRVLVVFKVSDKKENRKISEEVKKLG